MVYVTRPNVIIPQLKDHQPQTFIPRDDDNIVIDGTSYTATELLAIIDA